MREDLIKQVAQEGIVNTRTNLNFIKRNFIKRLYYKNFIKSFQNTKNLE